MSGHSKWSQIKHQKGDADKKRGQLFSKLLRAISIAAKTDPPAPQGRGSPSITGRQFNPRLRSAIEKAKENNVPAANIDRAISRAGEEKNLEELTIETYGPEGIAIIIEAVTDNKNRTVSEIKHLLEEHGAKMASPGSVVWSFEKNWQPKFPQNVSEGAKNKLTGLIAALEEHEDVQNVVTNVLN